MFHLISPCSNVSSSNYMRPDLFLPLYQQYQRRHRENTPKKKKLWPHKEKKLVASFPTLDGQMFTSLSLHKCHGEVTLWPGCHDNVQTRASSDIMAHPNPVI